MLGCSVPDCGRLQQDLSTLLDTCQAGLPEAQEVERLKLQSRAITPLLAPEQHAQVVNINGQHSRRLHGQKEAFNNLRELLSASGMPAAYDRALFSVF